MAALRDLHVFEVTRLVVDADLGRCDPAGKRARLSLWFHQTFNEIPI